MEIKRKETTAHEAYQKLTALCARSEHCQHEMTEKMRQWGVSPEDQAEVMARLVSERYVDDERYARAFVSDKVRYNKWGRRKIEQALWMKRIDSDICQRVLDEIDDEEYVSILKPLLKQKRKEIASKDSGAQKAGPSWARMEDAKLIKFAMSRGFTMDIIKQCITVDDEDEFLD